MKVPVCRVRQIVGLTVPLSLYYGIFPWMDHVVLPSMGIQFGPLGSFLAPATEAIQRSSEQLFAVWIFVATSLVLMVSNLLRKGWLGFILSSFFLFFCPLALALLWEYSLVNSDPWKGYAWCSWFLVAYLFPFLSCLIVQIMSVRSGEPPITSQNNRIWAILMRPISLRFTKREESSR
jgi:hypothetical protein